MIQLRCRHVGDTPLLTFAPEFAEDLGGFTALLEREKSILAVTVHTSADDIHAPGTSLSLVNIATAEEAWVFRVDVWKDHLRSVLRSGRLFVTHGASETLKALDRALGIKMEELGPRMFDTVILSHLLDPRQRHRGGIGRDQIDLARHYIHPDSLDTEHELKRLFARQVDADGSPCTMESGRRRIAVNDRELIGLAGFGAVQVHQLFAALAPQVKAAGHSSLATREHRIQNVLAILSRRGVRIDRAYTEQVHAELAQAEAKYLGVAARYGVTSVHNNDQVTAALTVMGEQLTELSETGKPKLDKTVLLPLADLTDDWQRIGVREPNAVADAVLRGRRAQSWGQTLTGVMLAHADRDDRVHATFHSLAARTARMSISRPGLQQLPSKQWRIRRCIVADPGEAIVAVDFSQVEMRVLAALCGDPTMLAAIRDGVDLHSFTAEAVFGAGFTPKHRSLAKIIGLGKVYGSGAPNAARETGAPLADVEAAMKKYDETFPGIKAWGQQLVSDARRRERFEVVTFNGRHIPMDANAEHTAINFVVQSTARDILADALLDIVDAGYADRLLLPVHDEVIATAPISEAEAFAAELKRLMEREFMGVPILADAAVYGPSWGHGYGATE